MKTHNMNRNFVASTRERNQLNKVLKRAIDRIFQVQKLLESFEDSLETEVVALEKIAAKFRNNSFGQFKA